jgi:hypothetical protein
LCCINECCNRVRAAEEEEEEKEEEEEEETIDDGDDDPLGEHNGDDAPDDEQQAVSFRQCLPPGFQPVLSMPALDATMVHRNILHRFNDCGWASGVVTRHYKATTKLGRKANFEVLYDDGDRVDHMFTAEKYAVSDWDSNSPGAWIIVQR